MTEEKKHTPVPWSGGYRHKRTKVRDNVFFINNKKQCIAKLDGDNAIENGEFILRAVNAHDALVGAIKFILEELKANDVDIPGYETLEEALALVEGKSNG